MRLVKTYKERGVTAKVYWDALYMEYRVCFEYDGIGHIEEADYFTDNRKTLSTQHVIKLELNEVYKVIAVAESPELIIHAMNVSRFFDDTSFITAEEAEARVAAFKCKLVELAGYSGSMVNAIDFEVIKTA